MIPCIDGPPRSATEDPKREKTLDELAAEAIIREAMGTKAPEENQDIAPIPLLMRNRLPGLEGAKNDEEVFKLDVLQRPDESSLTEYENTPVDQFGAAMLRGMGWSDGEAIGGVNKGLIQPIEFIPRPAGLGLGAQRDADIMPSHRKKQRQPKPGEKPLPELPQGPMVDSTGRVRHMRGLDEKLERVEKLVVIRDAYVVFNGGPHEGHCGRVRRLTPDGVEVDLAISDVMVRCPESQVTAIDRHDYKARLKAASEGKRKHSEPDRSSKSGDRDRGTDSKAADSKSSNRKSSDQRDGGDSNGAKRSKPTSWLHRNLRVRIVSESYRKGAFYNKKVVISDVLAPGVCTCTSDSGAYLDDLRESHLETLVPKEEGATIMVVRGVDSGRRGKLIQRQLEKERVVVQLSGDAGVTTFPLDDVCEFVGEKTIEDW